MPITIEPKLKSDERDKLAGILGCSLSNLEKTLGAYCEASLQEYTRMFLGQKVFSRGSDIREYRLFLLIIYAFGNKLPDEQKVCDLFQTTTGQSRALIRSVMSKYQYELSKAIDITLKETIANAKKDLIGGDYEFTVNSENIVNAMDRVLATIDGTLPQVAKKKGTVSTYILKPSSYTKLKERYGIVAKEV
jgi:hypothetical protein